MQEESTNFKRIKKLGETIVERAEKVSLPFFDGVPLYNVALFFWRSIVDGSITTRASAIAFSFFIAFFPGIIFVFTLIPYIPIENFQTDFGVIKIADGPYQYDLAIEFAEGTVEGLRALPIEIEGRFLQLKDRRWYYSIRGHLSGCHQMNRIQEYYAVHALPLAVQMDPVLFLPLSY